MKILITSMVCVLALSVSGAAFAKGKEKARMPASADFVANEETVGNEQETAQRDEGEVTFVSKESGDTDFSSANRVTCEEVAKGPAFCKGKAQKCSDGSWKCKPNCFMNHGHKMCVH